MMVFGFFLEGGPVMNGNLLPDRWLFDHIAQGMFLLDRDRRILALNRHAQEFFEIGEDEAKGAYCWDVTGFSLCADQCPFGEVLASGLGRKTIGFDCALGRQAASLCLNLTPMRDEQGEVVAVMECFQDATILKDLADRLQKQQTLLAIETERSRTVINSIADGIYTVDLDMCLTGFSRSAEKMTGYREDEVLGRKCSEVLRSSVCESDCPLKWTLRNRKPIQNCTATLVGKDDRRIPAFLSSDLLRDADGDVCGCIAVIRDRSEVEALKDKLRDEYAFSDFTGKSKAMVEIFDRIRTVAPTEATVLIEGESGTGKELMARAIHYRSSRKGGPFVKVNCASLAESLLESELFGHERGAFTGAIKERPGRFELADGGTLFLDEVGDTSPALQAKLLRVLQEREFERVGGIQTRKTDVRIIAATNKVLRHEIEKGHFREDLYYRLCVVPIHLPPLRERREDIPLLAAAFVQKFNARGERISEISSRAMALLMAYDWPGNIRELENAIEHAFVTSTTGRIERQFLPASLHRAEVETPRAEEPADEEARQIIRALEAHRWRKHDVARQLGMSRTTLWRKMRQMGLE
jgi:PAS domain S-box-containing protein